MFYLEQIASRAAGGCCYNLAVWIVADRLRRQWFNTETVNRQVLYSCFCISPFIFFIECYSRAGVQKPTRENKRICKWLETTRHRTIWKINVESQMTEKVMLKRSRQMSRKILDRVRNNHWYDILFNQITILVCRNVKQSSNAAHQVKELFNYVLLLTISHAKNGYFSLLVQLLWSF